MSTALIVLVGTLFGGAGLKLLELLWSRFQEGRLERKAANQRFELRAQELQDKQLEGLAETLKTAQDNLRAAEAEIDKWREEYFDVRTEQLKQLADLQAALLKIKELENEIDRLKSIQ
jgi:chromosome segregation ATPase